MARPLPSDSDAHSPDKLFIILFHKSFRKLCMVDIFHCDIIIWHLLNERIITGEMAFYLMSITNFSVQRRKLLEVISCHSVAILAFRRILIRVKHKKSLSVIMSTYLEN